MSPVTLPPSADLLYVRGRPVFTFAGVPGLDPRTLHGTEVLIHGTRYRVESVSAFALTDVTGLPFGLVTERVLDTPSMG